MAAPSNDTFAMGRLLTLALSIGVGYLLFRTFQPFFTTMAWAALIAYSLNPVYRWLRNRVNDRDNLAALLMSVGVTIGIIIPLVYMAVLIGEELMRVSRILVGLLQEQGVLRDAWREHPIAAAVLAKLEAYERVSGLNVRALISDNLAQAGAYLVQQATTVAKNVLHGLVELLLVLLTMFYLFRDGRGAVKWISQTLPFPPDHQRAVAERFHQVVIGAVFGNALIALLEGVAGGLAFWIVALPSPLLWGVVMGILAFIPLLGAGLVWVPAALFLAVQGRYGAVVILCIAGAGIALLDYLARTILVGERSELHTLIVFFSVLGGLPVFGLIGIILGPLLAAIAILILERERPPQSASATPR